MIKSPRFLKLAALGWLFCLLAALVYRYSPWTMTGKSFNEDYGIVVIGFDGSIKINGTQGTLKKDGLHTIRIDFPGSPSGGPGTIDLTRDFGSMSWRFGTQKYTFKKLPTGETASIDRTLETTPNATLIRRWSENTRPQRLIVRSDGTIGFDDNLIRIFLNSKHSSKLTPDQWLADFSSFTLSGKIISSSHDIPGYSDRPIPRQPSTFNSTTRDSTGIRTLIRHSYRELGGVVYRHQATFKDQRCLTLSHQEIAREIGHGCYNQ